MAMDQAAAEFIQQQMNTYFQQHMGERDHSIAETQERVKAVQERTNELLRRAEEMLEEQRRVSQDIYAKIKAPQQLLQQLKPSLGKSAENAGYTRDKWTK